MKKVLVVAYMRSQQAKYPTAHAKRAAANDILESLQGEDATEAENYLGRCSDEDLAERLDD